MNPLTLSRRNRAQARAAHVLAYQGQPCRKGHVTRYTANALCVECAKARRAEQTAIERDAKESANA